ncbi:hypothetical protein LMG26684_02431 [Achromobacter mucicolens]|uniref:T6SS effector BTH_I2691 family protein n=1 Tax=Achromobacter mucicolens TaxID=1389922 RepID=UPI0014692E12|nr:T6SS effector BTH_I2691 family protein [Achromobacter mucicolens]CAB3857991.1 hypothetical protein LMG26684_02431 [Achromobacter mucicolens]
MTKTTAGGAKSAPACCPRIPILPIRYAIVPNSDGSAQYRYAKSGFSLEMGFPFLQLSSYTLRAIRPGYVYVFMKGPKGEKLVIHEYDGEGHYQELTYTGLENYDRKDRYKAGARMGWVWADTSPETAKEVWVGYSPHLWTNDMTAKISADATVRRLHMRPLDMAELTSGVKSPSGQPHVLPAVALTQWVEDFKPRQERLPLDWSSHASKDDLPVGTFLAQRNHYRFTQPRVPAVVVLNDAEGLCHDLGLSVAGYQHQTRDLMPSEQINSASGTDNAELGAKDFPRAFRQDVEVLSAKSQSYHHRNLVALLLEKTLRNMYPRDKLAPEHLAKLRYEYQQKQVGHHRRFTPSEMVFEVLTTEHVSPAGGRLGERIDKAKYHQFLAERDEVESRLRRLHAIVAKASEDHDQWLATAETACGNDPNSLAAPLTAYDRKNRVSAIGLEVSLSMLIHPMSQSLPGTEDDDPRFTRLNAWLDKEDSLLYTALAPYDPFKEKADAVGSLLGAADYIIEDLAGRFPATAGVTDLTAQSLTTVVLKRMRGKTRWEASRTLRQQVLAAADEANASKAMGLLSARYRITDEVVRSDAFSREVDNLINSGMAKVEEIKKVRVHGSRTVTIEETLTRRVKPNIASLLNTTGGGALNVGMLWFNIVSLRTAYANLRSDPSFEYAAGFASALFGLAGAAAAVLVSARASHKSIMLRVSATVPGMTFGNGHIRFISSNLFTRLVGYPAIFLGFSADALKAIRQAKQGDMAAASLTFAGGIASTLGGVALLEGTLAIAGATAVIPFAGWAAAAFALLGAGVLAIGLELHAHAKDRVHQPIELWAVRGVFGTRQNDGEKRKGINLDPNDRLPPYPEVRDEIKAWYSANFAPVLLDDHQAKSLGITNVDSRWHENTAWSIPNWGQITTDSVPTEPSVAEFTVLLRGYITGQSDWKYKLSAPDAGQESDVNAAKTAFHLASGELVINFKIQAKSKSGVELKIEYQPNQGLDESAVVFTTFKLMS